MQPTDPATFREYSYFPLLLPAIFQAGVSALNVRFWAGCRVCVRKCLSQNALVDLCGVLRVCVVLRDCEMASVGLLHQAQPFAEAAASVESNATFQTYLKNVTSKAYFQGTTEGSIGKLGCIHMYVYLQRTVGNNQAIVEHRVLATVFEGGAQVQGKARCGRVQICSSHRCEGSEASSSCCSRVVVVIEQ